MMGALLVLGAVTGRFVKLHLDRQAKAELALARKQAVRAQLAAQRKAWAEQAEAAERAAREERRFNTQLASLGGWGEVEWLQCDPREAYFAARVNKCVRGKLYRFRIDFAEDWTFVRVVDADNDSAGGCYSFKGGDLKSADEKKLPSDGRDQIHVLATDLAEAARHSL
jgi:hypothetical protein